MSRGIETIDSSLSQDPACASLLPKTDSDERFNNNLFGQFKGFTLTPISTTKVTTNKSVLEQTKPAPPPPTVPTVMIKTNIKPQQRNNAVKSVFMSQSIMDSATVQNTDSLPSALTPPALPPLNCGSTARPLISSPVLATTTCTSMELIGKAAVPTRPAPEVPARPPETLSASSTSLSTQKSSRPNSTPLINVIIEPEKEKRQDREKNTALSRIASILKPGGGIVRLNSQQKDEKSNSLPRNHQHQKAIKVIDKEILRNLEISNPIPQMDIDISTSVIPITQTSTVTAVLSDNEKKNVVMRAQSMRDNKLTNRPAIQTFGSMRQSNSYKRPTSIPASVRPTSPPPPVPLNSTSNNDKTIENLKIPGLPGYQNPTVKVIQLNNKENNEETYDDCLNLIGDNSLTKIVEESLSPSNDNIYAVIEDPIPMKKGRKNFNFNDTTNEYKTPKPVESTGSASETMGLLSEIVSEISNRNFDSIYSTSTLTRKKKEKEQGEIMEKNFDNLGSNSSLGTYVNSNSNHYKSPSSVYSNSVSKFNSAVSETSSGYLLPSAVNIPRNIDDNNKQIINKIDNITSEQQQSIDDCKLDSLKSNNPNVNDAMSKVLGLKPVDSPKMPTQLLASTKQNLSMKKIDNKDNTATKSQLSRTKTTSSIDKITTKTENSKTNRQNSDTSLKSMKNYEVKAIRQSSDTSLKSNKSTGSKEKKDNSISTTPKTLLSNTNKNKTNNSPDLVSSCSTSSSNTSESPDVLGDSAKVKNNQKSQSHTRGVKTATATATTPSTPRPNSITTKTTMYNNDRKKSPTGNIIKSTSITIKDTDKPLITPKSVGLTNKIEIKSEVKCSPVQKAAGSKTNVASLQQKFEQNKATINPIRSISSVKKSIASNNNNNNNNDNNDNCNIKSDEAMTKRN